MDRSIFPDAVAVRSATLEYQTDQVRAHVNQRLVDMATPGVVSGLTVTVNALDTTRIDIAPGRGYAPGGEEIEVVAAQTGLGLASYTANTGNYVCLIYTEVASRPEAHATSNTAQYTRVTRSFRAAVLTFAQYTALVASSADLSVDALDRTLVCAAVQAQGTGVALSSANILSALVSTATPSAASSVRLLAIDRPPTITGIVVTAVDGATTTTLEAVAAGSATPLARLVWTLAGTLLSYRAPGDANQGTGVNLAPGGVQTLTSDGAGGSGRTITVDVRPDLLPRVGVTVTDDLTVTSVYTAIQQRGTARDELARRTRGSAAPMSVAGAVVNPAGYRGEDFGLLANFPGVVRAGAGLTSSAALAVVPRVQAVLAAFGTRTLLYEAQNAANTAVTTRKYWVRLTGDVEETHNARWDEAGNQWVKDNVALDATRYCTRTASNRALEVSSYTPAGPFGDGSWAIVLSLTSAALLDLSAAGQFGTGTVVAFSTISAGGAITSGGQVQGTVLRPTAAAPGAPVLGTVYSSNTFRSGGRVETNAGGAITLQAGFNFTAALVAGAPPRPIRITFGTALPDTNYSAVAGGCGPATSTSRFFYTENILAASFDVWCYSVTAAAIVDFGATAVGFAFHVL